MTTHEFNNIAWPAIAGNCIALLFAFVITLAIFNHSEIEERLDSTEKENMVLVSENDSLRVLSDSLNTSPHERHVEMEWLARMLLSETDRPSEMEYVAWVARNRVEHSIYGDTYKSVVLYPRAFSAFNSGNYWSSYYRNISFDGFHTNKNRPRHTTKVLREKALEIAYRVSSEDPSNRPFSENTTHFYSPISMKGGVTHVPLWVRYYDEVSVPEINRIRFRFYDISNHIGTRYADANSESTSTTTNIN